MKIIIPVILSLVLSVSAFAQEAVTETQKIDEFGAPSVRCCDFGARVDFAMITQRANPGSQVHVVYYSGRKYETTRRDRQGREKTVLINPMRNEYRDFQKGFMIRAAFQKVDMTNFILVNGGYRERMAVEVWLVPAGAEPPKPLPTIDEKTVKFRKGTPRRFARICDET
jgi:hypothetical protein